MWRDPFLNLCFVILVITALAIQHSVVGFGPTMRGGGLTDRDLSSGHPLQLDGDFSPSLRAPVNFSRAAALLDDIWERAMVIEVWWMDYTASQWELFNASSPAEADLLETRFHVANAEVFTDAVNENDRAMKELARAEASLDAARGIANAKLAPRLSSIREEIATAESHKQAKEAFSTVPFETIKADFDHVIAILRLSKT